MQVSGNCVAVDGALTLDSAATVLADGRRALAEVNGEIIFDLSGLAHVDSSALAVVFAWMRDTQTAGSQLKLANAPQSLLSLAEVYGVSDLLPLA